MTLTDNQRNQINYVVGQMMECNTEAGGRAGHDEEYGVWYDAANGLLAKWSGLDIEVVKRVNWNWYGNASFADDVEAAFAWNAVSDAVENWELAK